MSGETHAFLQTVQGDTALSTTVQCECVGHLFVLHFACHSLHVWVAHGSHVWVAHSSHVWVAHGLDNAYYLRCYNTTKKPWTMTQTEGKVLPLSDKVLKHFTEWWLFFLVVVKALWSSGLLFFLTYGFKILCTFLCR